MLAGLKGWLLGEPAFDPQSIHVSIVAQLTSTEAYVTTDISLARQLMELKRVADAWRLAVREREIPELNLGTPTGLLPRVEAIEEALDHVCVDWALDVRSAMDAACAVWLDPDTLLGNELSFGTRLQQITIQGASGLVAIAMLDFHARAEINERIWTKAATVVIGSVLREKALAPDEYAAIGLASRGRHEVGAQEAAGAAGRTARRAGAHDQAGPTSAPGHWPHLLSFALPGIEQRARELDGLGVRARAYRRAHAQGEFAFVFETDAHDPAMAPAAAAALLNARSARIEALMRGVVRDLNRALAVDLPLELVLPPTLVGVEPICGALSSWTSGDCVRSGALREAMHKLEQQRALARTQRAAASAAGAGSRGRLAQQTRTLFGETPSAERLVADPEWLRALQLRLYVPRLGGLGRARRRNVKLHASLREGLVISHVPTEGVTALLRAQGPRMRTQTVPLAAIARVAPGLPPPARADPAARWGRPRGADERSRMFCVLLEERAGGGALVFKCERPSAAEAWVQELTEKVAEHQARAASARAQPADARLLRSLTPLLQRLQLRVQL